MECHRRLALSLRIQLSCGAGRRAFLLGRRHSRIWRNRTEIRDRRLAEVDMMKSARAAVLPKIEQKRAVDEVHQCLRDAILTRQFSPGQRLDMDSIARQLGVSLTPVRGAISLLAADGLVDVQPRSGTYVATVSAKDVEETMDIRCALECLAAEKAVARLTKDDLKIGRASCRERV